MDLLFHFTEHLLLTEMNERLDATVLMVTHDAFSASYCRRILFIKDGKICFRFGR